MFLEGISQLSIMVWWTKMLPISFPSSMQVINETNCDDLPTHERVALIYQHQKASCDAKQINNRKDDVLLAHLQSSHHLSLRQYLHWLNPSQHPICPKFHLAEQDLHHWLCKFPATATIRQQVFRNHKVSSKWLATWPRDVVAYARKTLVNLDA